MLLSNETQPTRIDAATGILRGSAPSRLLVSGDLGGRLIQAARLAASLHMAQSAERRRDRAQFVPTGAEEAE